MKKGGVVILITVILIAVILIIFNIGRIKNYLSFKEYTNTYNKLNTAETDISVDINANTISENEIILDNGIKISLISYENNIEQKQLNLVFGVEKENSKINSIMYNHMILKDNKSLYPVGFSIENNLLKYDKNLVKSAITGGTNVREATSKDDNSYKERIVYNLEGDFVAQNLELVLWNIEYQENTDSEYKKVENQKAKFNINIK